MTAKVRIRIKRPLGETVITRKVLPDGKSSIIWKENPRRKRPEWRVNFGKNGCVYRTKKMFLGGKMDTIDVFPWSEEAVQHNFELEKDEEPLFDREQEYAYVHADVLKELGGEDHKIEPITYIILFLLVGTFAISVLSYFRGR